MLKAERSLIMEFEKEKHLAGERISNHDPTQAVLAEIRRRIAEIQEGTRADAASVARQPQ
jgi:hypothetical protein